MATQKKFNEGKACDAVIKRIEAREGSARKNEQFPEQVNHAAPVELVCDIGGQTYAFEHTGIEPFPGHVQLQVEAKAQLRPIIEALAGALPLTEDFTLQIPLKAMEGLKGKNLTKAQQSIIEWVKESALTLPIADVGRNVLPITKVSLSDVPFEVSLHRSTTGGYRNGIFKVDHLINGATLQNNRLERIREAYTRKWPKLAAWRRAAGARLILILEENDIQLTNSQLVADAITLIEKDVKEKPDEIYLVTTSIDDPWWIWAMRIDSEDYYTLCASQKSMTEVSPSSLLDLTHPRVKRK
jgi:hypothetical protein